MPFQISPESELGNIDFVLPLSKNENISFLAFDYLSSQKKLLLSVLHKNLETELAYEIQNIQSPIEEKNVIIDDFDHDGFNDIIFFTVDSVISYCFVNPGQDTILFNKIPLTTKTIRSGNIKIIDIEYKSGDKNSKGRIFLSTYEKGEQEDYFLYSFDPFNPLKYIKISSSNRIDDLSLMDLDDDGETELYISNSSTNRQQKGTDDLDGRYARFMATDENLRFLFGPDTNISYPGKIDVYPLSNEELLVSASNKENNLLYRVNNKGIFKGNKGGIDFFLAKFSALNNWGEPDLEWLKMYGGTRYDHMTQVITLPDSNYIVLGQGTSSNGDLISNNGYYDVYVFKINIRGQVIWQKNFGGESLDFSTKILRKDSSLFLVLGSRSASVMGLGKIGERDIIVAKLDLEGNIIWRKRFGEKGELNLNDFKIDQNGNLYLPCSFHSKMKQDSIVTYKSILLTLSPNGELLAKFVLENSSQLRPYAIEMLGDNSLIVLYLGQETSVRKTGIDSQTKMILRKMKKSGEISWEVGYSPEKHLRVSNMSIIDDRFVLINGTIGLDKSRKNYRSIMLKYDLKNGDLVLEKVVGDVSNITRGMLLNKDNTLYQVGYAGEDIPYTRLNDAFVRKIDISGNTEWEKIFSGQHSDAFISIDTTSDGGFIIGGETVSNEYQFTDTLSFSADDFKYLTSGKGSLVYFEKQNNQIVILDSLLTEQGRTNLIEDITYCKIGSLNNQKVLYTVSKNQLAIFDEYANTLLIYNSEGVKSLYELSQNRLLINYENNAAVVKVEINSMFSQKYLFSIVVYLSVFMIALFIYGNIQNIFHKLLVFFAIFDRMETGLIFLRDDRILKINKKANIITGLTDSVFIRNVERNDFYTGFGKFLNSNESEQPITINGTSYSFKKFLISIKPIFRNYTIVFITENILHDNSEEVKLWTKTIQKMVHDIKTPLSSINIGIKGVQLKLATKNFEHESIEDELSIIAGEAYKIKKLSNNFLKVINLETPNFEKSDISKVLEISLSKFDSYFNNGVKLSIDSEQLPLIKLDKALMDIALTNIISNSIEAINQKGVLEVNLLLSEDIADRTKYVRIEISDNGPGINKDIINKIFEPFFTTKTGGSGIGLSITKQIILQHGGNISVKSESKLGTTFVINLPVKDE